MSQNNIRVAIVIPCYNEGDNILSLWRELQGLKSDSAIQLTPVFVNDCSKDDTLKVLSQNKLNYINLPVNLGIGGAVQTGYKYAFENNFDIAVQMDGDGQHPPIEIFKIIQPIIDGTSDVVIGSRYIDNTGFQSTRMRRIGIKYFKWLNKFLVGVVVNDSTSGYRAINRKTMKLVVDYYPDEYPEPESIILYKLNNLTISEVPVIMRDRQGGESSIKSFKSLYYMLKVSLSSFFLFIRLKTYRKKV